MGAGDGEEGAKRALISASSAPHRRIFSCRECS
jgi:predicted ATP-dependent serine protease